MLFSARVSSITSIGIHCSREPLSQGIKSKRMTMMMMSMMTIIKMIIIIKKQPDYHDQEDNVDDDNGDN